ncbi:flagellar assembly protein FliW [Robertmurraya beringensis]|uniref:Flagellar assembly factor FliW n=1 Tax=Robertmurraya beringensis TaxID=641660 RepID=A0ABV6KWZ4_9BACI
MELRTKYHGTIEIDQSNYIYFSNGIPGFHEEIQFVILPLEEDETFYIMQSVNTPTLAFVMINPFAYYHNYDFILDESVVECLKIDALADVLVYSILTVQDPFKNTTVNLQAPVIINTKNNFGKQIILNNEKYLTRHKLVEKR